MADFFSARRAAAMIKKEFHSVLLDKKTRAQLFAAPLCMLFIFSFAVTMEVKNVSLAVLNEDAGDLGARFVSYLSSGTTFTRILTLRSERDISETIERQHALAALRIPEDFSRSLISGQSVTAATVLDGRKINAAQIAEGYIEMAAARFELSLASRAPGSQESSIDVIARYMFNPNLTYSWFTLPVLLSILTQMIALTVSGMSVARERELGTFEQLLVSPLSKTEIVVGKAAPAALLAFCEATFIHIVSRAIFGVPFTGSEALLAVCAALFILSVTGVGLFISSLCATQQQAFLGCFTYMVPAVLLSGFVTPIENMPYALRTFTRLNPMRHILKAVLDIYLKDAPFTNVFPEMLQLGGIAVCTLSFAGWYFGKKTR